MTAARRWTPAGAVAATVLVALLAGCTGDGDEAPPTATGTSAAPSAGASGGSGDPALAAAAADVTRRFLTEASAAPAALSTVRGEVVVSAQEKVPATLAVLSVRAGAGSTVVRWSLATDRPVNPAPFVPYSDTWLRIPATTEVAIEARQANLRAVPPYWTEDGQSNDCACAWLPERMGPTGFEMSDVYPPLPAQVTEITLRVSGFPAVTVPVTRS